VQPLALAFLIVAGFLLRQVWLGRGADFPTDARDLFVALGGGDWAGVSAVTARRGEPPASGTTAPASPNATTPGTTNASGKAGYQWQVAQLQGKYSTKVKITSTTNHSRLTSSGNVSYHVKGQAVDIVAVKGLTMREVFDWLRTAFPGSAEIIYTPGGGNQVKNGKPVGTSGIYGGQVAADHNDHIHWAYTGPYT